MRQIKWLGQAAISDACLKACEKVHGAQSGKPDPIALLACVAANCSGAHPPATMPPPGLTLPAGTVLPGGLTLPAGWTLPAGLQLPAGWNLPAVPPGLPPGWPINSLPPGFQLPSNWTLPTSWTLPGPLTLPTALTIPPGTPLPPNLPTVPPPAQTAPPPLPSAPTPTPAEKKDNTVLWVVGGLAAVAAIALVATSRGGGLSANPKGGGVRGLLENPASATRYVGDAVVKICYDGYFAEGDRYSGTVTAGGRKWHFKELYAPKIGFNFPSDSAQAYDEMAESAVGFGGYYTTGNRGDVGEGFPDAETADAISEATMWATDDQGTFTVRRRK